MMVYKLIPVLYTAEIQQTIDFYVQKLGFACTAYQPAWGWASMQLDQAELMISLPNQHFPFAKPIFTGSFYFLTDKVALLWNRAIAQQLQICYPLEEFEYGMKEFAIYDNNGYILQFGQPLTLSQSASI
ncbi:MAG: VOC family protein [Cytophagales bacterium]|nr:VOC family protein [Bernardetiaceae bacterium]MDW8205690.1 VOC family protein [Cytophagales bacterium]